MSSSSESGPAPVLRERVLDGAGRPLPAMPTPDLRTGDWTRRGGRSVLGDEVTESLLTSLAVEAREAATAQGYAVGWAEGRREAAAQAAQESAVRRAEADEAQARRDAEHADALAALAAAADEVRGVLADLASRLEDQGTELAWAVVEELLAHQVEVEGGADVVRRVLRVLPASPVATVRLHPDVAAGAAADALVAHGLTVRADPGLGPADALVEHDGSVVDLRIDAARERIRAALGQES